MGVFGYQRGICTKIGGVEIWGIELYESPRGTKPVKDFLDSLEDSARDKVYASMELLKEFGVMLGPPHVKKLKGTRLWELRVIGESNVRMFYVVKIGKKFLILHGFLKKSQKTPEKEIEIAEKRLMLTV